MSYYATNHSIVKIDPEGVVVWQFTGEQIDGLLDDIKRMEALLTDLATDDDVTAIANRRAAKILKG